MSTAPRLIFLHVPRTSGTTLHAIMARQYPREAIHDAELFLPDDVERFRSLPEEARARIRVLKGHMAFGLHGSMPGPSRYLTMVRDPIDRLVSYYYYVRRRPQAALHEYVKGVDLATFVRDGAARDHTDNSYVRFYSGEPFVEMGTIDEVLLEKAKANLANHFAVVGQQRHFDETILMLKDEFGWKTPYYQSENVTAGRPKVQDIDDGTRKVLDDHTRYDREIFDFCLKLYQHKLNAMPDGFEREVRLFKQKNRVVQKAYPRIKRLRRKR
ncbi:MAG TPA: sulfotransferase family 2 domain-containing protein [Actinomycetota bacterium]|nr:sulfotransferase family 2 domain-containing protein [Actinomycetota bacterium]